MVSTDSLSVTPIEIGRRDIYLKINQGRNQTLFRLKGEHHWFRSHFKVSIGDIRWKQFTTYENRITTSRNKLKYFFPKYSCPYPHTDIAFEFGYVMKGATVFSGAFEFIRLYHKDKLFFEQEF